MSYALQPERQNARPIEEDKFYFFSDLVFLVENCLFKVPRLYFERDSAVFRDMFLLPTKKPEGESKENPLRLDGVRQEDFRQLLRVMYPANCLQTESLSVAEWNAVLKLSTMWEFEKIQALAISELVTALKDLALKGTPVGVSDIEALGGVEFVLRIKELQGRVHGYKDAASPNSDYYTYKAIAGLFPECSVAALQLSAPLEPIFRIKAFA